MVILTGLAFFALDIVCKPKAWLNSEINDLENKWNAITERDHRLFEALAYLFSASVLLGSVAFFLNNRFDWRWLGAFEGLCKFLSFLTAIGFTLKFGQAAALYQQQERIRARMATRRSPRVTLKTKIGSIIGPVAFGEKGTQITQTQVINWVTIQRDLFSLVDDVKSTLELDATEKHEAVDDLSTLADQGSRPPERREHSKIVVAIERVSRIVSAVSSLHESWSKLEPWINAHFHVL